MEMKENKSGLRKFLNKPCRFIVSKRNGDGFWVWYGTVEDINSSFVVERDRFGKLHFLDLKMVKEITEISELKRDKNE